MSPDSVKCLNFNIILQSKINFPLLIVIHFIEHSHFKFLCQLKELLCLFQEYKFSFLSDILTTKTEIPH